MPHALVKSAADSLTAKFAMFGTELTAPEVIGKESAKESGLTVVVAENTLLAPRATWRLESSTSTRMASSSNQWAAKTINKLDGAADDYNGALTAVVEAETPNARGQSIGCA